MDADSQYIGSQIIYSLLNKSYQRDYGISKWC